MTLGQIKGMSFRAVEAFMYNRGLSLWDSKERRGGLFEITYIKTACGITIEEATVLFGWNGKVVNLQWYEGDENWIN